MAILETPLLRIMAVSLSQVSAVRRVEATGRW